jgi:hypothetical protein
LKGDAENTWTYEERGSRGSTHARIEKCIQNFSRKIKIEITICRIGLYRKIILKCLLNK